MVLIKQLRVDADAYDQAWLRWWCSLSVALMVEFAEMVQEFIVVSLMDT